MINKSLLVFIIITSITYFSCSKPPVYVCGLFSLTDRVPIDSKLLAMETLTTTGTAASFVEGIIIGKDSIYENATFTKLENALLIFHNKVINDSITNLSDIVGNFEVELTPGIYDITIKMIGYTDLQIINLQLNSGERKYLKVELGQWAPNSVACIVNLQETNFDK